jgi:hypothetical protein
MQFRLTHTLQDASLKLTTPASMGDVPLPAKRKRAQMEASAHGASHAFWGVVFLELQVSFGSLG